MQKILFISVLFLGFLSCQNDSMVMQSAQNYSTYFDTQEFVLAEIQKLLADSLQISKEINLNGNKEVQKIAKVDSQFLFNEFKFIYDANINKPAYYSKYRLDTFSLNAMAAGSPSLVHNTYQLIDSLDKKIAIKSMSNIYNYHTKEPYACLIHLESKNFMNAYAKDIYYQRDKGIRIDAWEKTMFQDTIFYNSNLIFE